MDKEGKEIILLGDTNCDLTPKQAEQPIDNDSKHMLDLYELFSFKQLIGGPTRVTLTTSSTIDHIATTCARNIVKSGVHEISLSDHYMQVRSSIFQIGGAPICAEAESVKNLGVRSPRKNVSSRGLYFLGNTLL